MWIVIVWRPVTFVALFYRPCSWNERQAKLPSTDTTISIFTVRMKMMMMNYDDDEETVYLCVETLLHISHTGVGGVGSKCDLPSQTLKVNSRFNSKTIFRINNNNKQQHSNNNNRPDQLTGRPLTSVRYQLVWLTAVC